MHQRRASLRQHLATPLTRVNPPWLSSCYVRVCDPAFQRVTTVMRQFNGQVLRSMWLGFVVVAFAGVVAQAREPAPRPPSELYGALFQRVQTERVFADSKTFADASANLEPEEIMRRYAAEQDRPEFSLASFVAAYF